MGDNPEVRAYLAKGRLMLAGMWYRSDPDCNQGRSLAVERFLLRGRMSAEEIEYCLRVENGESVG